MLRRIGAFETDEAGVPTSLPTLEATSRYVVCRDEESQSVGPCPSREFVATWIGDCVLGDLRTLQTGIRRYAEGHATGLGGGNFLLGAGCCMALEYLGQVYGRGRDATSSAAAYVREFMDARYTEIFELFWSCLRNGILHGSWPQAIGLGGSSDVPVSVWVSPATDGPHLEPHPDADGPSLVIAAGRLFVDLEASFYNKFRSWILNESDDGVLDRAAPRLLVINPRNEQGSRQLACIQSWTRPLEQTSCPTRA